MSNPRPKTAAYRLFHYRYDMMIPQMYLYGKDYLQKNGYHVSGDGALDRARLMEPAAMKQTAAGLAMLHAEGAPIILMNPKKDTSLIYGDIQEHLLDWERLAVQGVHPNDAPPIEDFRKLEAVAIELYQKAKFYEPQESDGSEIRDRLRDAKGNLKAYVSIVDRIEKELIGSRKQWQ